MDIETKYNLYTQGTQKFRPKYDKIWNSQQYKTEFENYHSLELKHIKQYFETDLIKSTECQSLLKLYPHINLEKLTLDSQNRYYDYKLMLLLACNANLPSKIYMPYSRPFSNLNSKIFWNSVKIIGEGKFGRAYVSTNKNIRNKIVIKYSKHRTSIIHETFISSILNRYRSQIPNFMFGLGYFRCSSPLKTEIKNISSICNLKNNSYYGIYEYISELNMVNYITDYNIDLESYLNIFIQILLSLWTIKDLNYSHNDLHPGNVLIRPIKQSLIPYEYNNETIYIKTTKIATIIDYGANFMVYNGVKYGPYRSELAGAYSDKPNYIMDPYKFLMFSSYVILKKKINNNLLDQLGLIFRFFNKKDDFRSVLVNDRQYYYNIDDQNNTYRHSDLIAYLFKSYSNELKDIIYKNPITGIPIVGCNNGVCLNETSTYIKSIKKHLPRNIISFYQESKNFNLRIDVTMERYFDETTSIYVNGYQKTHRIITSIISRGKNDILPKLEDISKLSNLGNMLSTARLDLQFNTLYDSLSEAIISKDALINFYLYFKSQLESDYSKLIQLVNEFERAANFIYLLIVKMITIIKNSRSMIIKLKSNLDLKRKKDRKMQILIKRLFSMYTTGLKYIRYLKNKKLGEYDIKDLF